DVMSPEVAKRKRAVRDLAGAQLAVLCSGDEIPESLSRGGERELVGCKQRRRDETVFKRDCNPKIHVLHLKQALFCPERVQGWVRAERHRASTREDSRYGRPRSTGVSGSRVHVLDRSDHRNFDLGVEM